MKQYLIKPSFTFLVITICLYGFATVCLLLYFKLEWFTVLLSLLLMLWLYLDIKIFMQANKAMPERLTVNSIEGFIEFEIGHQFKSFNVYTSRSSIIIKLSDKGYRKNIILLADRFRSRNDYLDCRYQLMRLNQGINAS